MYQFPFSCFLALMPLLPVGAQLPLVPLPAKMETAPGFFPLSRGTLIQFPAQAEGLDIIIGHLRAWISELPGENGGHNMLLFNQDPGISNPEGYRLKVKPDEIRIEFAEPAGAFYALMTLRQLRDSLGLIPCLNIEDEPRYPYRGMHLDVCRHFFPVEDVKKYIDQLALHKMNRFHWHLTEDQGWRIEIKKYPKLQEIAAFRKETLIGHYSDQPHRFDGKRYGGYYTQEEIREVVEYARQRFVTIIPEIEMPGHATAVIAAYPELSCHGRPVEVATLWGVFEDVLCPTEQTFEFMENVLLEVMDLFPGEYIHIGGDECPKVQWKESAFCQELIAREGLKNEEGLQSYFIRRIDRFLTGHGRKLVGWDEILEGGLSPNATVMSWRGTEGGIAAAKQGHDVIMAPTSYCYFDYYQARNPSEPLSIGGFVPLEKVYSFEPTPAELSPAEAKHILGAQGNIWTEYKSTYEQVEYNAYPRAFALAEVLWTPAGKRDFKDFQNRLALHLPTLKGVNYARHLYDIQFEMQDGSVVLSNRQGQPMMYKMEGMAKAAPYKGPVSIDRSGLFQALPANGTGRILELEFHTHAAFGKKVSWKEGPHPNYQLGGAQALSNGLLGSEHRFGDGEWLGWWGKDVELTVDLEEPQPVSTLQMRFFQSRGEWIYLPKEVKIFYSKNGIDFRPLATQAVTQSNDRVLKFDLNFRKKKARYWKIEVIRYGIIPDGAQGAGHEAWVFLDEVILR